MAITQIIKQVVLQGLADLYEQDLNENDFQISQTKPEFEGDYTVVLFSLLKKLKKASDALGQELGAHLAAQHPEIFSGYNVIKGFLNLVIEDGYWRGILDQHYADTGYGTWPLKDERVMVEYSSPNTNKPLHLGHLRNNFLGWSTAAILRARGYEVVKTCIANDRGIHICKSMVAWQLFANGATPQTTGIKGDHFVGDYYVLFGIALKEQVAALIEKGIGKEEAEKQASIMQQAQQMLVDWEAGKPGVLDLWEKMNGWVYEGFAVTYKRIGSDFDKTYYESDTYLLGKDLVEFGLQKGVFYQKEDSSVWIDLTAEGLDEKIVRRRDGTAVYMTQDIGLVVKKYEEFKCDKSIYVVGNEQDYHFKVLKLICQKLDLTAANGIFHLSYGMVELPSGRMKTREGTVVDADDMIDEMVQVARQKTEELGKVKDFSAEELTVLLDTIGLGALKFFLLRVDPKKKMLFNPDESIDFHGFTGPFIQYTHARIKSILRKEPLVGKLAPQTTLLPLEKELLMVLEQYPVIIEQAATEYNPSLVANYAYAVAKTFNSFYTAHSVANAESEEKKQLRLRICQMTANIIASAMELLGVRVPERM
ncbi:MAG: arginine--tRNA ligase [Bacteroidota bacterium]